MTRYLEKQDNIDDLAEQYAPHRSNAARMLEREVLGREVGLNGYTTVAQADVLRQHLALSSDTHLLEIGAGRGWPGNYFAESSGCRLTSTDVPFDAVAQASESYRNGVLRKKARAVVADGRALPFGNDWFDAVVHADVFC